jgi:opacity protein-like surface antigen
MVARLTISTAAALVALGANAALAADYPPPPPPPIYVAPPPPAFAESWYLRGYVGIGMTGGSLEYTTQTNATLQHNSYTDAYFIGAGIGYEWNSWLRFDFSAEYRAKSRVYALVTYPPDGIDEYQGYLKSWIFMANAFVDLGTWECFTPFVGFGIGAAYNQIADFSDVNPNGGYGFGRNSSDWNFAWALHAGVAYSVTPNFKIDLSYRYLNYGSVTDIVDCNVTCTKDSFKFDKLYSHDIMLGLRWTCCELPPPPPPQVYVPPPIYTPLRSKG